MPRRTGFTGKPDDWLRRAKGNLARAKQTKPKDAFWEDLCFDAQQAAEKAIKAVLVFRELEFRKTHDLRELLTLLDSSGYPIPEAIRKVDDLTDYAVETRYPGLSEPVSDKEYRDAVLFGRGCPNRLSDVALPEPGSQIAPAQPGCHPMLRGSFPPKDAAALLFFLLRPLFDDSCGKIQLAAYSTRGNGGVKWDIVVRVRSSSCSRWEKRFGRY